MSVKASEIAELDRFYPPCGPCAFCGHRDKRHRVWDAWLYPIEAGNETIEGMARAFGFDDPVPKLRGKRRTKSQAAAHRLFYSREHLRAVLRVRPYRRDTMTIRKLAMEVCAREAGKAEVNIAQVSEVLARLADIAVSDVAGFAKAWALLIARAVKRATA